MDEGTQPSEEISIGGLFHQLIDDGKGFVRAEANLYRQIALYRAGRAKFAIAAFGAAFVLALAGTVALMVGLVIGLAKFVGPVAAGLIILAVSALIAWLLVRYGMARISALSGSAEEQAALAEGERKA